MTVVVDMFPAADLSPSEARALTDRIKVAVDVVWELVIDAYQRRAWVALGYATWDDYTTREFGTSRLRLPREERPDVVCSLREAGLSTRAIVAVTGLSKGTVGEAIGAGAQNRAPDTTGLDGKTYPAKSRPSNNDLREMFRSGRTIRDIAAETGLGFGTVQNAVAQEQLKPTPAYKDKSRDAVAARVAAAKEMAAAGHTSRQIAETLGLAIAGMDTFRRRHGIEVPADAVVGGVRHHDSNRIIEEMCNALEAAVTSAGIIQVADLDLATKDEWVASLTNSIRSLNRFIKQIKETTL